MLVWQSQPRVTCVFSGTRDSDWLTLVPVPCDGVTSFLSCCTRRDAPVSCCCVAIGANTDYVNSVTKKCQVSDENLVQLIFSAPGC